MECRVELGLRSARLLGMLELEVRARPHPVLSLGCFTTRRACEELRQQQRQATGDRQREAASEWSNGGKNAQVRTGRHARKLGRATVGQSCSRHKYGSREINNHDARGRKGDQRLEKGTQRVTRQGGDMDRLPVAQKVASASKNRKPGWPGWPWKCRWPGFDEPPERAAGASELRVGRSHCAVLALVNIRTWLIRQLHFAAGHPCPRSPRPAWVAPALPGCQSARVAPVRWLQGGARGEIRARTTPVPPRP